MHACVCLYLALARLQSRIFTLLAFLPSAGGRLVQVCFIMEQDKIRPWSRSKLGGGRRSRSKPCERNALVPRPPPLRTLRAPPSSCGRLHHHRHLHRRLHHSPSPPLSLNTAARTCPLAFLARDRCSAAAKPTRAAVVCASSLAPPVALLSACGVSVTHARASLEPPCRVWAAPLACLCCAALHAAVLTSDVACAGLPLRSRRASAIFECVLLAGSSLLPYNVVGLGWACLCSCRVCLWHRMWLWYVCTAVQYDVLKAYLVGTAPEKSMNLL